MRFQLNGDAYEVDPEIARSRILSSVPDPVLTHWVEIEGRRWPAKQAFEVATGIRRSEYISHTAVRLLARLGFDTSDIPTPVATRRSMPNGRTSHDVRPLHRPKPPMHSPLSMPSFSASP